MMIKKNQPSGFALSLSLLINLASMLGVFLWLAFHRNVDGDEGLYLEAARLIGQGHQPYFDFFYQQMPLIPYLYAGWMKVFGFSLFSARVLSAALTAASGFIIVAYIARTTKNLLAVNFCSFLFFANGLVLAWAPVIKTHPFNLFALTLALVCLMEWRRRGAPAWLAGLAGLAIGFGINCRLTLGPYAPLFALYLTVHSRGRRRFASLAAFIAGAALLSLPTLYFFLRDPELFLRFNLYYHIRIFPGISSDEFRLSIARAVFAELQMIFLSLLFLFGLLQEARRGWRSLLLSDEALLFSSAALFILVHLKTATPFTQYFSALVPLLILGLGPVLAQTFQWKWKLGLAVLLPCMLVYAMSAKRVLNIEINSMGSDHMLWELDRLDRAVAKIKEVARPGEPCVTWWPGYAFLGDCASPAGMENHMRNHAIDVGIPRDVLESYKMMSDERLVEHLDNRFSRVVIAGVYRLGSPLYKEIDRSIAKRYRLVEETDGVKIYVAKDLTDDVIESYILYRETRKRKR